MSDKPSKPPPKPDELSAFRKLLGKLAKVHKRELDAKEEEYQRERESLQKKAR